jgi:hypothetical protein
MKFFGKFCIILVYSKCFFISGCEESEKAFYALSSLQYSLDNPSEFDNNDINFLYDKASLDSSIVDDLEMIKYSHDNTFKMKRIKKLRKNLQQKIFSDNLLISKVKDYYPSLDENHLINEKIKNEIRPYCLPQKHNLNKILSSIFMNSRVTFNEETLSQSGFQTLFAQPISYIYVLRHQKLHGYLLKVYLDSETRLTEDRPGWKRLLNRCKGAENIRKLIERKKLKYFSVPDKWLYPIPSPSHKTHEQPVLLVVTDMNLTSHQETLDAWQNISKRHLEELFCILSHGFSSNALSTNIPYSRSGKFACIDTEHPKRVVKYNHVKAFLTPQMREYWNKLIKSGGKI